MGSEKRYSIKSILLTVFWMIGAGGTTVLLVAAVHKKDARSCRDIRIEISGVNNNWFVDKADVMQVIRGVADGDPRGKAIGTFNLKMMETSLEKSTWIKAAELFFDNNDILRINIIEREPVARIFTIGGATFYIDTAVMRLPLSDKSPARLPVFTSFPSDNIILSAADSGLLRSISSLSMAIQKDPFRMALIDQIDITADRNFEMIPKIGDQVIVFGDANDAEEKFDKLKKFYRQVMTGGNWSRYSTINVQYKGQVVAKLRGAEEKTADSLRTLQLMQLMAERAERNSGDTIANSLLDSDRSAIADTSMIQRSIQRDDDEEETTFVPTEKPEESSRPALDAAPKVLTLVKPAAVKPTNNDRSINARPIVARPANKPKPKPVVQKPKAVMPKDNGH